MASNEDGGIPRRLLAFCATVALPRLRHLAQPNRADSEPGPALHRLMMQHKKLLRAKACHGIASALIVGKLDLIDTPRKILDNGTNLAPRQSLGRKILCDGDHVQYLNFITHRPRSTSKVRNTLRAVESPRQPALSKCFGPGHCRGHLPLQRLPRTPSVCVHLRQECVLYQHGIKKSIMQNSSLIGCYPQGRLEYTGLVPATRVIEGEAIVT